MPIGLLLRASRRVRDLLGRSDQTAELISDSPFETVLHVLKTEQANGRTVRLRDVHQLTGMTQPDALRCIEQLKREGSIQVETMVVDPLGGIISIK